MWEIFSNFFLNVFWYDKINLLKIEFLVMIIILDIKNVICIDIKNFIFVVKNIVGNDIVLVDLIVNCK